MKQNIYTILLLAILLILNKLDAQEQVIITNADITNGSYKWTSDKEYLLDGYVILETGGLLEIEAGTTIKGINTPSSGEVTSALIIDRGARIEAMGTAQDPIVFTAELDDGSLTPDDKGLWGGIIILGHGIVGVNGGETSVEGIASTEGLLYGGFDNADDSGILRYVSIRHGGSKLEANNEINGLTLAGVGSGTEIDYIEVFANLDDGIELFGGAVNVKHAVVSYCGDDSYDFDQSWDGKGQFWFTIQNGVSNRAGEWDGSEATDLTPKTSPLLSNLTFIGAGVDSENEDGNNAMQIRDDGAAKVYNSIFTDFADGAIQLDNDVSDDLANDSYQRFVAGDIEFVNNIFFNFGDGSSLIDLIDTDGGDDDLLVAHLENNNNVILDPMLAGVSRMSDNGLDPRLNANSTALIGATLLNDPFFDPVVYKGAFGNDDNWAAGWTALSQRGFLGDLVIPVANDVIIVKDEDINAGETYYMTANNTYILDGYVFVEAGATLIIEAGTIIKGKGLPSGGEKSSALIISQGGRIEAIGTADAPIIFTAEFDEPGNTSLTKDDKGLWGGIVILGKATVGVNSGVTNVEGIPSTENRAQYGGDEDDDDSGILKYVSIRHGGDKLEANNEINGLTLAGVGSETIIDYIEVYANLDDGIEWFGGTVNVNHAIVAFCGDDSYDYDQSWDGKGQFWFSIQDENSDTGGEWDGSEATDLTPKASPVLANLTFIGAGTESNDENNAIKLRDDGAAQVYNSVFTEFANDAIRLDNDVSADLLNDSYQRFLAGDIVFSHNVFFNIGGESDFSAIVTTDGGEDALLVTHLTTNSNIYADPGIAGISRNNDGGLDPRINGAGAAWGAATTLADDYFQATGYSGAFFTTNWAEGWTALSANGFFGNLISDVDDVDDFITGKSLHVFPNPVSNGHLSIVLDLDETKNIAVNITDMNGRLVKSVSSAEHYVAGKYQLEVDVHNLSNGFYMVNVISAKGIFSNKIIITK
ncbi:T9SS type A sorting domain-containing protein [Portibacter marinus]|uniref:T9SS type A sorting domain-containing protein n=1 Tax=Portibacter marinus TaxID=2898660 RepID=UPI001F2A921D|nr:T9SS type A sorting domain-containing protein [Portibacter marinus]